jgi:hypothetical protein
MSDGCESFVHDRGRLIVGDMSIVPISTVFTVTVRPHGVWILKLKSLENIPAGDRQFLYNGLILCSTKLLKSHDNLHS